MSKFVLTFCALILSVAGFCLDRIGRVTGFEGSFSAVDINLAERTLETGGDIFLGDLLITGAASKGLVKFMDGTAVLLIADSRYMVDDYSSSGKYHFGSKLYEGGIRVSTGLIAKKTPENFMVETPNATIGVRGTVFEARQYDGNTYFGSSSGNISVQNQGGRIDLGAKEESRFAVSSSQTTAPTRLASRPEALSLSLFTAPGVVAAVSSPTVGAGASAGTQASSFIGPAVGSLMIIGTLAGVVAGVASTSSDNFSHTSGHVHSH